MKIIDQTPFYNEKGELSLVDRAKALMQFGKGWFSEMEAQKAVLPVLEKVLDKNYTLLRNTTPPGLDTPIPFILVGPTGILVIYVTHVLGMFRAKGDQWGTISSNAFKAEKPNLLTRTDNMARAVQMYLQRQGFADLTQIEAVLMCANAGVHVDSLRPIVRIVMRDALERFAVSITQARLVLSPEAVTDIINNIINPPEPKQETPPQEAPLPQESDASVPSSQPSWTSELPSFLAEESPSAVNLPPPTPAKRKVGFNKKQWLLLVFMALIWCLIMAVFIFLVVKDLPL